MRHPLKWFINRIGKRIYRKPLDCSCKDCQKNYVDIVSCGITGQTHANYLYDCQNEMNIHYSDKPIQ
jgi:hypothetical protein